MFTSYYGLFLHKACRILIGYISTKLLYYCFIIRQEKSYSMTHTMQYYWSYKINIDHILLFVQYLECNNYRNVFITCLISIYYIQRFSYILSTRTPILLSPPNCHTFWSLGYFRQDPSLFDHRLFIRLHRRFHSILERYICDLQFWITEISQ